MNAQHGLMDGSGARLQQVYDNYELATDAQWLDWQALYDMAQVTTGEIAGSAWYHWVALRGVQAGARCGSRIGRRATAACTTCSRVPDFNRRGPFRCVWLI